MIDDYTSLSATELATRIRTRDISPVEAVDACIERIEAANPDLNAVVFTDFEGARRSAREAESKVMRGEALGPFHGVPMAIKDAFDFKPGWITTFGGVRAFRNHVTDQYCLFAERMEAAGAVLVGKTNSPVFGFRGTCDNYLFGPTRNPFDLSKNSGGSSGGSAAAVAAGMFPLAEGADGGGSIRIPAAWCGVFGYKASFGRIANRARPNAFVTNTPFVHEGPISRTVEDAARALTVLSGDDPSDPYALTEQIDFAGAVTQSIAGLKIGYSADFGIYPVDPEIRAMVGRAVTAFEEAGAEIVEVDIDLRRTQGELSDLWCRLMMASDLQAFEAFRADGFDLLRDHRDDFPPEFLRWVDITAAQSVSDHYADQAVRTEVFDAIQKVFRTCDLLVTPTLACMPVDNATDGNTLGPREIEGEAVDPLIGWCMTYLVNFTGHPAASVPAGLSASGLPVGMQIIGRRNADATVLAASAAFERLRPWADAYRRIRV